MTDEHCDFASAARNVHWSLRDLKEVHPFVKFRSHEEPIIGRKRQS
jgi:hypothetical protein